MITTGSARQAAGFESRGYCRLILPRSHRQISGKSRHNGWSARRPPGAIATGVHGCGGRLLQFLIEILPVQSPDCVENLARDQRREAERGFVQHQQASCSPPDKVPPRWVMRSLSRGNSVTTRSSPADRSGSLHSVAAPLGVERQNQKRRRQAVANGRGPRR